MIDLRTQKKLQQSTGTCRYMLNVPGPFSEHCYMQDPQIRIQKFGANLMNVKDGHPIDIDSDLKGVGRKLKAGGMLSYIKVYKHNEPGKIKNFERNNVKTNLELHIRQEIINL